MATRVHLKELADLRLKEAEALFEVGLYDGCVYLCGYVVELALKARICTVLGLEEYPDHKAFKTHGFDDLQLLAGLKNETVLSAAGRLFENWSITTTPEIRYEAPGSVSKARAEEVLTAIREEPHGIYTWLRQRW